MPVKQPRPGELEPIETASRDEISALQLQRLQWSLRHCYDNVAAYRKKCQDKGVHPDELKQLSDLSHFPFMTKSDLRDHYPFGLLAVPREQVARLHASSGTTGKSVVVGYTRNDLDHWANVVARSIRAAGGRSQLLLVILLIQVFPAILAMVALTKTSDTKELQRIFWEY